MPVNSYLIHGPDGVVIVDGMLTVSDATSVRQAVATGGGAIAGVVVTHPHPDHYAGLGHLVGRDDLPVIATRAVDAIIRRDDEVKNAIVGPMMGAEWPATRPFPNQVVEDGAQITLGGLTLTAEELGPGESDLDTLWWLDAKTVFAGDVVYNGMHAYLADGRWADWLETLQRLEARLPDDVTLYIGHGAPGGKELLAGQRRYIETFVAAVDEHADALLNGADHAPVVSAMTSVVPSDDLLFLMELSIEPVLAALRGAGS
ncbi:MAG TPA: MBL fold metallo-hydrolase [Acidimicrobiales bacterium]|nr:MBL fold metallo-hydrolase [Acidimicrobiales bacterium]